MLTEVKIDKHQESQKNIVTIEFATLDLFRVQNFIKIEALSFLVHNCGLKTDRCQHWQVSILTGIKNYKKTLSPLNSGPLIYVEFQISSKMKLLQVLFKTMA